MLELAALENELDQLIIQRIVEEEETEESSPSVEHLSLYSELLHAAHFLFSLLQSGISLFKFR